MIPMNGTENKPKESYKEKYGSTVREYKDRLFKFIFGNPENKQWTLSLYNAMNGTNYDDPCEIIMTTIKGVLYMSMKNDVSFIVDTDLVMNLWEQQSSYNPNTPLRILIVNDINFRTLMSEVCFYADERFYLKVQILMSFTISMRECCIRLMSNTPKILIYTVRACRRYPFRNVYASITERKKPRTE